MRQTHWDIGGNKGGGKRTSGVQRRRQRNSDGAKAEAKEQWMCKGRGNGTTLEQRRRQWNNGDNGRANEALCGTTAEAMGQRVGQRW
jgi:hypothetical protein